MVIEYGIYIIYCYRLNSEINSKYINKWVIVLDYMLKHETNKQVLKIITSEIVLMNHLMQES